MTLLLTTTNVVNVLKLQGSVQRRMVSGLSCVVQSFGYHTPKKDWNRVLNPSPQDVGCRLFQSLFAPGVPQAAFMGIGYGFGSITNGASMHADGLLRAIKGQVELPVAEEKKQKSKKHQTNLPYPSPNSPKPTFRAFCALR